MASILPFSCLVTVNGKRPVFRRPPTPFYLLFPSIPERPQLMMSYGTSESLPACACRYTMSFTLEGVVSMYTRQTITTKIFPACSFFLLWPRPQRLCVCVCLWFIFRKDVLRYYYNSFFLLKTLYLSFQLRSKCQCHSTCWCSKCFFLFLGIIVEKHRY